jgi:hypothetical protein
MPIIENKVKKAMELFLCSNGYLSVKARMGTRKGYDVEGINPKNKKLLVIECKGEAQRGNQRHRSWPNVASAILTSLNETHNPKNTNEVGIALPDTELYRERIKYLKAFFEREGISVFLVSENGSVQEW